MSCPFLSWHVSPWQIKNGVTFRNSCLSTAESLSRRCSRRPGMEAERFGLCDRHHHWWRLISATRLMVASNVNKFLVIMLGDMFLQRTLDGVASAGAVAVMLFGCLYAQSRQSSFVEKRNPKKSLESTFGSNAIVLLEHGDGLGNSDAKAKFVSWFVVLEITQITCPTRHHFQLPSYTTL